MKKRRKISLSVMLVLILTITSLGMFGCEKKVAEQQLQEEQPQAFEAPQDRILRFNMANCPKLDPAVGYDGASANTHANLYDTLVFPYYDGTLKPHLATHWDISDDGRIYTFYLRQGVKFHNGDELTSRDVAFSMQRMLTIKQGKSYLFEGKIKNITAPDKYTVTFELNESFGPFLATLVHLFIVNEKQIMANLQPGPYGEYQDYGTTWLLDHDAGSGPYMVKEFAENEYLLAEKFKDYWGGFKPNNPEGFKLIGTAEPVTIRTMMARRELEISDEYQSMEWYDAIDKIDGIYIAEFPGGKVMYVMMNTTKPPADDVHLENASTRH